MKNRSMTPFVVVPLLIGILPLSASASPLDPARLPEDAKWVVHVDLEALGETALAEKVRQNRPQLTRGVRQWFQERYGIDPREDLDSLTMFGESYEAHTGTMVLQADYDREKVKADLEEKPDVQKESWQDHTLYTVTKEKGRMRLYSGGQETAEPPARGGQAPARGARQQGQTMTIVLLDDSTVVFASSADRAKAAVKLLQGDSSSLGEDSPLLGELEDGAMVYGAAVDLGEITQRDRVFPILRQHERIYWSVGEDDGEVFQNLKLIAQSEEVAEKMQTGLEGLLAFGKVWAADSESLKQVMENREITREGRTVQLEGRSDSQTVLDALTDLRDRAQRRRQEENR